MQRRVFLTILLLGSTSFLSSCMSPEQLAETAKRFKERKTLLEQNNPPVLAVFAKRHVPKGDIIKVEDVEERQPSLVESNVPNDALHQKNDAVLKKAKNDITSGQIICAHDLAPLVGQ